mmetsp:Transcript_41403/g.101614  ORF Transcript_41403/g.101614 Transcript_41403/m.101614 type:complete len:203 (+) Transcript_41403:340-948(+)
MDSMASTRQMVRSPDQRAGPQSPARTTVKSPGAVGTATRNDVNSKVLHLCDEGLELYSAGKYDEAEDAWKRALQISSTDVRTLLHYAVLVRDVHGDKERFDQLMLQAMGEWGNQYSSLGLTEPAKEEELRGRPRIVSPKKDMAKMAFSLSQLRSNVEFYSLKNIKNKVAAMEARHELEHHHEEEEEGGAREGGEAQEEHIEL